MAKATHTTCTIEGCTKIHQAKGLCKMHYTRLCRHGDPLILRPTRPLDERFWKLVLKTDGCWLWTGYCEPRNGYAVLRQRTGNLKAYRISYELAYGAVPAGMVVDHICHNVKCVRPDHLRAVTPKQNVENFGGLSKNNTSGYRGVYFHKASRLWHAAVKVGDKHVSAGYFETAAEAGEAARQVRLRLHTHNDLDRIANTRGTA